MELCAKTAFAESEGPLCCPAFCKIAFQPTGTQGMVPLARCQPLNPVGPFWSFSWHPERHLQLEVPFWPNQLTNQPVSHGTRPEKTQALGKTSKHLIRQGPFGSPRRKPLKKRKLRTMRMARKAFNAVTNPEIWTRALWAWVVFTSILVALSRGNNKKEFLGLRYKQFGTSVYLIKGGQRKIWPSRMQFCYSPEQKVLNQQNGRNPLRSP